MPISAISWLDFTSLNNKANRYGEILPLLLPAAVMVIPYVDMLRAVIRRTRAGLSPFAPDRKHLHHTMLEIGHSHRSSVLILYAWAALFAATVLALSLVTVSLEVLVLATLAGVLSLALLSIPKLRWWERNRPEAAAGSLALEDRNPAVPVPTGPVPAGSAGQEAVSPAGPVSAGTLGPGPPDGWAGNGAQPRYLPRSGRLDPPPNGERPAPDEEPGADRPGSEQAPGGPGDGAVPYDKRAARVSGRIVP